MVKCTTITWIDWECTYFYITLYEFWFGIRIQPWVTNKIQMLHVRTMCERLSWIKYRQERPSGPRTPRLFLQLPGTFPHPKAQSSLHFLLPNPVKKNYFLVGHSHMWGDEIKHHDWWQGHLSTSMKSLSPLQLLLMHFDEHKIKITFIWQHKMTAITTNAYLKKKSTLAI